MFVKPDLEPQILVEAQEADICEADFENETMVFASISSSLRRLEHNYCSISCSAKDTIRCETRASAQMTQLMQEEKAHLQNKHERIHYSGFMC